MQNNRHLPVLLTEVLDGLAVQMGETVLDTTVGLGGHSAAFLEAIGESGHLIALDADSENLEEAKQNHSSLSGQKTYHHKNFREISDIDLPQCDVIFADLGVSSPHFDDPERGFSFRSEGPLDLRFDRTSGQTAAEIISSSTSEDIQQILSRFGEVRSARKLADEIMQVKPQTTQSLKECVENVCGFRAKNVLPQVFQAFRIAVNNELYALEVLLGYAPSLLKKGGRLAIISFHSLEDRMVKQKFRELTTPVIDETTGAVAKEASFNLFQRKAIKPTEDEIKNNSRARSARLRILLKAP